MYAARDCTTLATPRSRISCCVGVVDILPETVELKQTL